MYLAEKLGPVTPATNAAAAAAETKPPQPPVAGAALSAYAGQYRSPELGVVWTVAVKDSGLIATVIRGREVSLKAVSHDKYTADGMAVSFARDAKGKVNALLVTPGRSRNIRFVRE